jgi:hypothetical protein
MSYPIALVTHLESDILKPIRAHSGVSRVVPARDDDFARRNTLKSFTGKVEAIAETSDRARSS